MRINSKVPFLLPLFLFFISGIAGVWFSYSPENSFTKLILIASGIFLYIAIAMLRGKDQLLAWITRVFLFAAALFALYFNTQNDFAARPSKFHIINLLGVLFNNLVPRFQLFDLDRDTVVGLFEIALPLNIAAVLDVWTRKRRVSIVFTVSALLILFGLMSSSMRSLIFFSAVSALALILRKLNARVHFSAAIWALTAITIVLGAGFILLTIFNLSLVPVSGLIDSHM